MCKHVNKFFVEITVIKEIDIFGINKKSQNFSKTET